MTTQRQTTYCWNLDTHMVVLSTKRHYASVVPFLLEKAYLVSNQSFLHTPRAYTHALLQHIRATITLRSTKRHYASVVPFFPGPFYPRRDSSESIGTAYCNAVPQTEHAIIRVRRHSMRPLRHYRCVARSPHHGARHRTWTKISAWAKIAWFVKP